MYQSKFKISKLLIIISMGILFSGCVSPEGRGSPLVTDTVYPAIPSSTQTPSLNQASVPTDTLEPSQSSIITKCVEITHADLPKLEGALVLEHTIEYNLRKILFRDMETQQEHFISNEGGEYYSNETVSPAGTYFSAETFTFSSSGKYQQGPIIIFDSEGNRAATIEPKKASYGLIWLNEEQILMNDPYNDGNPVFLISPFKHTQKTLQPFILEYFDPSDTLFDWNFYGSHKNVYDPQMTRMLYPARDENGVPNVVLRNLKDEKDLASFPTSYGYGSSPIWSLDGEKIAIALNTVPFKAFQNNGNIQFEIFVINRDGKKLFTTNLASLSETVHITNLSWSPNGRFIAFWYTTDKDHFYDHLQLAIFDTQNQIISRYCNNSGNDYIRFSPIWAPTSDYLIVARKVSGEKTLSSLLVNIFSGKAWIVKPDFEPVGWLR